jgi:hypothetical protein
VQLWFWHLIEGLFMPTHGPRCLNCFSLDIIYLLT